MSDNPLNSHPEHWKDRKYTPTQQIFLQYGWRPPDAVEEARRDYSGHPKCETCAYVGTCELTKHRADLESFYCADHPALRGTDGEDDGTT